MEICRERTKTLFHCSHCRRWALSSELIYSFSTNRSFSSSVSLWIRENLRDNSTPIVSLLLRGGLKVFFVHIVFICLKKLLCFSFRFAHSRNISSTCKSFLRAGSRCGEEGQMCTEEKFIVTGKKLIKVSRLIQDPSPKFVNEILVSSKPACCNIGGDERTREETKVWHSVLNWFDKVRLCWQPSYFKDGKINKLVSWKVFDELNEKKVFLSRLKFIEILKS